MDFIEEYHKNFMWIVDDVLQRFGPRFGWQGQKEGSLIMSINTLKKNTIFHIYFLKFVKFKEILLF